MNGGPKKAAEIKSERYVLQNWLNMDEVANDWNGQRLKTIDNWPQWTKLDGSRPKLLTKAKYGPKMNNNAK